MNGYKKLKNMNANRIRVKSSRISPAPLLAWTEFQEKDVSFIVLSGILSYKPIKQQLQVKKPSVCIVADVCMRGTVSCCSRSLCGLWHLYKPSLTAKLVVVNLVKLHLTKFKIRLNMFVVA